MTKKVKGIICDLLETLVNTTLTLVILLALDIPLGLTIIAWITMVVKNLIVRLSFHHVIEKIFKK